MQLGNMRSFAAALGDQFSLASISVLARNLRSKDIELAILFEPEDAREANHRYIDNMIYDYDPFINMKVDFETHALDDRFCFLIGNNIPDDYAPNQYKSFMIEENIKSFGASIRSISSDVDIIIGIHGKAESHVDGQCGACLAHHLSRLQDITCFDILREMLQYKRGSNPLFRKISNDAFMEKFSPRETDVLSLIRQGKRNKDIAYTLNITENTVEGYLKSIFKKAEVTNRSELILKSENIQI